MNSYSHPVTRQDLWVLDVFAGTKGSFVELGAYDGVTHSNTLLLEQIGWRGLLIEAVPEHYERMVDNRPDAKGVLAAIGSGDRLESMYVNGEWSGLISHMPKGTKDGHIERNSQRVLIRTVPLSKFTLGCDYLSLDTEGSEYEILRQWFSDGGRCAALTVEFNYDSDKFTLLCQLCEQYGMHLDQVRGFDLCFLRNES